MKHWEYKIAQDPDASSRDEFKGYLDEYGRNGWELCAIHEGLGWVIFKREKSS